MIRVRLYVAIFGVFVLYSFIHEFVYRQYEGDYAVDAAEPIDSSADYDDGRQLMHGGTDTVSCARDTIDAKR